VENRSYPSNQTGAKHLGIYLDPTILSDLEAIKADLNFHHRMTQSEAQYGLLKKNGRLWVQYPDGSFCDFPYYLKNVTQIIKTISEKSWAESYPTDFFDSFRKNIESLEKKIFSNVSLSPGENAKDLWDDIFKKINSISANSHTLKGLIEKILDVPFLQHFQSSILVLHLKGQTKAELMGTMWRSERVHGLIEVKEFNLFFNTIKKSKIKSFSTEIFPRINIPFNGSFLAKEVTSKKYSLISIVSRHDFLAYDNEEIELFETCIDLLQPHFERLIDQEFSDKKISELRMCLKEFPLPLRVKDSLSGISFMNDLYHGDLQDQDIFFNKKFYSSFSLDLYDSDELRHYAFDLFHFQRISLLGELLNTLRHELSNPLFGLKLSSQIFTTFPISSDDKFIMEEIEKNINRCQAIIENFSDLYQIQSESRPILLKKIIDESLVLAKSEIRELTKKINYQNSTDNIELNVPLIFVVQILFNLIINAAQAMRNQESRAELTIDIALIDSNVQINIIDNGPGIPEDKAINLFKPFYTTKPQGTGLGLVLSRNLAQKMGGNLEFVVNNNQRGAFFRLTLPII
jgi:signal transduction histidine kinase